LNRLLWGLLLLFALGLLILAYVTPSHAAVRPDAEPLSIRPQIAKERDKAKPLCLEGTTRYRLLMYPDGRKQYVGLFTIWERCK
jgi:hypothetical protein